MIRESQRDGDGLERSFAMGFVRWGAAAFLALHGLLHWGIASAAQRPGAFRVPSLWGRDYASPVLESIGLGDASRIVGGTLWMAAVVAFVLAGMGVVRIGVPTGWVRPLTLVGAAASLLVFWLFWTDPVWIGALISAAVGLLALGWPLLARIARPIIGKPRASHA
jgi:hypothetical protein